MRTPIRCPEASINTVASPLILLPYLDIPYPTDILFNEFAVRYVRGDMSMGGAGFPDTTWKWKAGDITRTALNNLITLGDDLPPAAGQQNDSWRRGSKLVYIRTRTNRYDDWTWQNFSAQMYLPVLTGKDGTPIEQWVDVYTNVSISFAGLVAL